MDRQITGGTVLFWWGEATDEPWEKGKSWLNERLARTLAPPALPMPHARALEARLSQRGEIVRLRHAARGQPVFNAQEIANVVQRVHAEG